MSEITLFSRNQCQLHLNTIVKGLQSIESSDISGFLRPFQIHRFSLIFFYKAMLMSHTALSAFRIPNTNI